LYRVNANIKIELDGIQELTVAPANLTQLTSWDILYNVEQFPRGYFIGEEIGLPRVDVLPFFKKKMSPDNMFFPFLGHG